MTIALKHPVAVYTAATNVDAHLVAGHLTAAGIDAVAVDDMSPGGMYSLGTLPELHRPQVFVDSSRQTEAGEFLNESEIHTSPSEEQYCYHCGAGCDRNSIECGSCRMKLDWDSAASTNTEMTSQRDIVGTTGAMSLSRIIRKPVACLMLVPIAFGFAHMAFKLFQIFVLPLFE